MTTLVPPPPKNAAPPAILLVEDEAGTAPLFKEILSDQGLTVHWASTGREAVEWVSTTPTRLMVLDYFLPDMTAQDLIATLRQSESLPPFIVITGHGDEQVAVDMMKLGAQDYLIKNSIISERLPQVVKRVLREIENEHVRQQLTQKLLQSQKMDLVGQLAGGVAHDFNNILQAIEGFSQLLLDSTPETDERRHDIEGIHRCSQRAATLTRQLLAFSRRQMLMPKPTDLNELISNLLKMLRRLLGENIECIPRLTPDLWLAETDPGQIEQVLINLAVNARDAMPKGGELTLSTSNTEVTPDNLDTYPDGQPGRFICISASDTGIGMTEETKAHLFEPFFTTKPQGKGSGLGLSTVYGIVKQHGGWITAHSSPDQGATFKVYLPEAKARPAVNGTAPASKKNSLKGNDELILLVEDEAFVRALTKSMLLRHGYRVLLASNCAEALASFSDAVPLVFSDILLPDGNGFELFDKLKKRQANLKCIFCSGYADIHERWPNLANRGEKVLLKPYHQKDLLQALADALHPPQTL